MGASATQVSAENYAFLLIGSECFFLLFVESNVSCCADWYISGMPLIKSH